MTKIQKIIATILVVASISVIVYTLYSNSKKEKLELERFEQNKSSISK